MCSCKIPRMFPSLLEDLDRNFVRSSRINKTGWKNEPRLTSPRPGLCYTESPVKRPQGSAKTMEFVKPNRLKAGDTVASLSPSWGGPAIFPRIYELGVRNLKANFHLQIKEYPTTRGDPELLHGNPEMRAKDVNSAFSDREVAGIISSIGGDDSIRILSYLSKEAIKSNPKVLMGYSDTT